MRKLLIKYNFEGKKHQKTIKAEAFAFDGCHKIYLIQNDNNLQEAKEFGYTIINNLCLLKDYYENSCPLKFIHTWSLEDVVPQFARSVRVSIS